MWTDKYPTIKTADRDGFINIATKLLKDVPDQTYRAYILATIKHECADTWRPLREYGSDQYLSKYDYDQPLGKQLGNTQPGDGKLFAGKGYVMITGRANYERIGKFMGIDLVNKPELACDPANAYRIIVYGMLNGLFTNRRLSQYQGDYFNMRRIINGIDQAARIAGYAEDFEKRGC